MKRISKVDRGVVAAVGAAVLFGLSMPLAKALVDQATPLLLAGLLYVGSGIGLAALLIVRRVSGGRASITWPTGTDIWWLMGAIAIGGGLGPYLLMSGLRATDSASASLILNLEGVFTALLAWFIFRENFDRRIAIGMGLIVAGGIALSLGPALRAQGVVGPIVIAGACLAWAIDNNLTRKVSVHDAMFIACAKGLVAGTVSVALALASNTSMRLTGIAKNRTPISIIMSRWNMLTRTISISIIGTDIDSTRITAPADRPR